MILYPEPDKHSSKLSLACFIFFLAAGLLCYSLPATDWLRSSPGDLGDARFNNVILEHLYLWSIGRASDLWSPSFFYPYQYVLAFSDNHFGSGPIYVLLRVLNLSRETAFSSWFVIGCTLNFICAYYCLRRLAFSSFAAGIGGFIYAFSLPADILQEQHIQLVYRYAIPLATFNLLEALLKGKLPALGWASFWVAIQFFCSIYLGLFLVYFFITIFVGAYFIGIPNPIPRFIETWKSLLRRQKIGFGLLLLFPPLCVSSLLLTYHWLAKIYGFKGSKEQVMSLLPTPSSYLLADHTPMGALIDKLIQSPPPFRDEHQLFFGFGVWVLISLGLYALFQERKQKYNSINSFNSFKITTLMCISAFLLFCLTLKVGQFTMYRGLLWIPGIPSIRAVGRIILVISLPVGILSALACDSIFYRIKHTSLLFKSSIVVILFLLATIEVAFFYHYSTPYSVWHERQKALENLAAGNIQKNSIVFVPRQSNESGELAEIDGMIFAQEHGLVTLNGYSGNIPPGYNWTETCNSPDKRLRAFFDFQKNSSFDINLTLDRVVKIGSNSCAK